MNIHDLKDKGLIRDPFPAPEGYFDDLSQRIRQRMAQEDEQQREPAEKVIRLHPHWYYAAAAVTVLLLSVWLINPFNGWSDPAAAGEGQVETLLAEVSNEALIDYLQMHHPDIFASVSLTETEQEALLEAELESYDLPDD